MKEPPNPKHIRQGEEIMDLAFAVSNAANEFVKSLGTGDADLLIKTAIDLNKRVADFLWIISLHNQENRKDKI